LAAIADALAAAHAGGVVHRDVKPSNVFLAGGRPDDPRLLDFGVARVAGAAGLTRRGVAVGPPAYMALEQIRGPPVDARADPFALRAAVARCGADLEGLVDGGLVAVLAGAASPVDLGARAARCALRMRDLLGGAAVAVATGRAVLGERLAMGDVLDRAAALL